MSEPVIVVKYVFARDRDRLEQEAGRIGYLTEDTARRLADGLGNENEVYRITTTIELIPPTETVIVDHCLNCNRPLVRKGERLVHRDGDQNRCAP